MPGSVASHSFVGQNRGGTPKPSPQTHRQRTTTIAAGAQDPTVTPQVLGVPGVGFHDHGTVRGGQEAAGRRKALFALLAAMSQPPDMARAVARDGVVGAVADARSHYVDSDALRGNAGRRAVPQPPPPVDGEPS